MKNKQDRSGIVLAAVTGIALLVCMLLRAFAPRVILPSFDSSALLTVSLVALVLEHYLVKNKRRVYWQLPLYALLIFGIFPWVACFTLPLETVKLAALGAVIFTVAAWLFDSIIKRLSTGPVAKAAPLISAVCLFLAAQCLLTII